MRLRKRLIEKSAWKELHQNFRFRLLTCCHPLFTRLPCSFPEMTVFQVGVSTGCAIVTSEDEVCICICSHWLKIIDDLWNASFYKHAANHIFLNVLEPSTISFQLADRGASSAPVPSLGTFSVQRQSVEHSIASLNKEAGNVGQEAGDGSESHDQSCADTLPKADKILFRCAYFCVTVLVALGALVVIWSNVRNLDCYLRNWIAKLASHCHGHLELGALTQSL